MIIKNYIEVDNKKYSYFIEEVNSEVSKITCSKAKIEQEFLNEDLVSLLKDLPNLLKAEQEYKDKKDNIIRFRVSWLEKMKLQEKVKKEWYKTISAFIKDKVFN